MKIYTGRGDRGQTSLSSGERMSKSHYRIEAYGDVDELNSVLGMMRCFLPENEMGLDKTIQVIQGDLFVIGAWLATSPDSPGIDGLPKITETNHRQLETAIDQLEKELAPLHVFILPGGHPSSSWCHIARTVCRRAERHTVRLIEAEGTVILDDVITYLNRLSDFLFVLARYCNQTNGVNDTAWKN